MKKSEKIKIHDKHLKSTIKKNPAPIDIVVKSVTINDITETYSSINPLLNGLTLEEAITTLTDLYTKAANSFQIKGVKNATPNNIKLVKETSGYNNYFIVTAKETEAEYKKRVNSIAAAAAEFEIKQEEYKARNRANEIKRLEKRIKQLKVK